MNARYQNCSFNSGELNRNVSLTFCITGQEPTPHNSVAFYAYMSHDLSAPGGGHVLVFDVVKTNVGSAYNHHDGIFTAPSTGSYVFSWTVTSGYHSYVYSELMVNSSPFGKLLTNSQATADEHVASSVVAVALTQGDVVYVRVAGSSGTLASQSNVYTSFTGWKLF